ncbi:MAG: hypothetical protein GY853_06720 [PVC group bacterium]|nr:hypothetical protein [PVC group bacterium]
MIAETERFKIYFRIPFTIYFIAKDMNYNKLRLMYRYWNEDWHIYQWKEV